jgi:hypothetical protein
MKRNVQTVLSLVAVTSIPFAFGRQGTEAPVRPAFEVASLKIALPPTGAMAGPPIRGGPGTEDPGRFSARWINLRTLITLAWDISPVTLFGPGSIDSSAYDIEAKVPANTSKEAFRLMFQRLLIERLQLVLHRETRQQNLFELVIAKGGPRLRKAEPARAQPTEPSTPGGQHIFQAVIDQLGLKLRFLVLRRDLIKVIHHQHVHGTFAGLTTQANLTPGPYPSVR